MDTITDLMNCDRIDRLEREFLVPEQLDRKYHGQAPEYVIQASKEK
jgi:hypothetical protein